MFHFTKLFWRNATPQKGKLLAANLINLVIMLLLFTISLLPVQMIMNMWLMFMFTGQGNMATLIIATIGIVLLILLLFLLVILPLYTGSVRTYRNALLPNKTVSFKDLFSSFKGKVWRKALVIGLVALLIIIVTQFINYFINSGISTLAQWIVQKSSISITDPNNMLVYSLIISVIIPVITSILTWLSVIYITNAATSLVHEPEEPVKVHLKNAWRHMKNKQHTFFKFFIGIMLLNLIVILAYGPVYTLILLGLSGISQNAASIIANILSVVFFLIRYFIFFMIIGTIVQYYLQYGEKEESKTTES